MPTRILSSRNFLAAALLLIVWAWTSSAVAAEPGHIVVVHAGKHDRHNTPVVVKLPFKLTTFRPQALLVGDDGSSIVGQITAAGLLATPPVTLPLDPKSPVHLPAPEQAELHFILPDLKAGQSIEYQLQLRGERETKGASFAWKDTPGEHDDLLLGDRPVMRYVYKPHDSSSADASYATMKPYHHLFSSDGSRLVTNGGEEPDGLYRHHRGLYYGFANIRFNGQKRADTWQAGGGGHQSHEEALAHEAGLILGRQRSLIGWFAKEKGPAFAKEQRELTAYNVPGGTLVDFASRLSTTSGEVKLNGNAQHAGFQFRAHNDVAKAEAAATDADKHGRSAEHPHTTYFLRPDGKGKLGDSRNPKHNIGEKLQPKDQQSDAQVTNLPWNAISFVLDGKRYTVAYLDKPSNPKESQYSERPYGRFGSYFVATLKSDKPVDVNYRVWVQDGEMTVADVARLSADFADPPTAEIKTVETQAQDNVPPSGWVALFNGQNLDGWVGLVGTPKTRPTMSAKQIAKKLKQMNQEVREHWSAKEGEITFDGQGRGNSEMALCTAKDYGNFEMMVDWKIEAHGDSGIYLRGSPQVQIWDAGYRHRGSGGLYNNKHHQNDPLIVADNPIGQWNHFYIKMVGDKVTVKVNGWLAVDNVVLENYWEPGKPIYPMGQLELQDHGSILKFKNIYVRELPGQ